MGSAAADREDKKVEKYGNLSDNHHFVHVGIETYGTYGPQGIKLVSRSAKKIRMLPVKIVDFFSILKYTNGNTTRQCSLRYGLPKEYIYRLRG